MKKVLFLLTLVTVLAGCSKIKITEKIYLKIEVDGTKYEFVPDQLEAGIIKAEDQIENREVFYVRTVGANTKPVFFIQSRTNLTLNQNNPILDAMPGDEAGLILNGKTYKLYNGTLNPEKIDLVVGIGGYMEGVFSVTLVNQANSSETVQVSGSYFNNNY